MKKIIILSIFISISVNLIGQKNEHKEKFIPNKWLHFKIGSTINLVNKGMYELLNESLTPNTFVSSKSIEYNPLVEIGFENQFSKHVGINIGLGFTQTRHHYSYGGLNTNFGITKGGILCNIPNLNIRPAFYYKNTCLQAGIGVYKYYYSFNPFDVGNIHFDLNSEGLSLYSSVGIQHSFEVKSYRCTATVNYFGLTKKYDNGLQLAFGIAI